MLNSILGIFGKPYLTVGMVVVTAGFAAISVNDIAAYGAAITAVLGTGYFTLRTIKSTLDRAEENTLSGQNKQLREVVSDQRATLDAKAELIETLSKINDELRDALHNADADLGRPPSQF